MSRARISQREAHRLRKRVAELEGQIEREHRHWAVEYPGTHLGTVTLVDEHHMPSKVYTARRLGFPVVCTADGQALKFFAVKP